MANEFNVMLMKLRLDTEGSMGDLEKDILKIQKALNAKGLSIKLNISKEDLQKFTAQIANIQNTISKNSKQLKFYDVEQIKKDGNEVYKNLNEITKKYKESGSRLSFPTKIFDPATKELAGFTMQITKADGEVRKLKFNLIDVVSNTVNKAGNQVQKFSKMWNLANVTSTNPGENSKQNLLYAQKEQILRNISSLQIKAVDAERQELQVINQQLIKEQQKLATVSSQISRGGFKSDAREADIKKLQIDLQDKLNLKTAQQADLTANENRKLAEQLDTYRKIALEKLTLFKEKNSDILDKNGMGTAVKQYEDAINNLTTDTFKKQKPFLEQTFRTISSGAADARKHVLTLGESFKEAFTKFPIWIIVATAYMQMIHQVQAAIDYTYQMDTALTDLNKVVDMSAEEMKYMKQTALDMGASLGQSSVEIMKGMAEWGRFTKSLQEINELTKVATMASNVTSLSVADASKALTTAMINFNISAKDSMSILDSFNEIQNNFRASAEDLADAIGVVGSVAKQSGVSIHGLEGYITAIVSATGLGGDEVGTALKSMMSRVYRIGSEGAEDAGKTEEQLRMIGVAVRDAEGNFRSFSDIIGDIQGKWKGLSNVQQMAVAQAVSGTMHYNKFLTLMQNFNIATDATNKALNSQGSANRENQKYMDSMAGKVALFQNALERMYAAITNSDALKSLVVLATQIVNGFTWVIETFGAFPTIITLVISSIALFKKELISLGITYDATTKKFSSSGWAKDMFKNAIASIVKFRAEWATLNSQTTAQSGLSGVSLILPKLANGFKALTAGITATAVAEGVATVATVALSTALTLGLSALITGIITGITAWITKLVNVRQEQEKLIQTINESISTLTDQKAKLMELADEYETLSNNTNKTTEEKDRQRAIEQQLVETYGVAATGLNEQGKAYSNSIPLIKARVAELEREVQAEKDKLYYQQLAHDKSNSKDIQKETNEQNRYYDQILQKQKNLKQINDALDKERNQPTNWLTNNPLHKALSIKNLEDMAKIESESLNKLIEKNGKVSAELQKDVQDRAQVIQNSANDYILKLEASGVKVSESSKAFVQQIAKSLAFKKTDINSANKEMQDFIQNLQNNNFDKLIDQYNNLKSALVTDPDNADNQSAMNKVSGQIRQVVDALAKDYVPTAKASKKTYDDFIQALRSSYGEYQKQVVGIQDLAGRSAELDGVVKSAVETQKEYTTILQKMKDGETLTADEAFKLAESHKDLIPYISETSKGFVVQEGALEDLRKESAKVALQRLQDEKTTTQNVRDSVLARVQAYGLEASALNSLTKTHESITNAVHQAILKNMKETGRQYGEVYNEFTKKNAYGSFYNVATSNDAVKELEQKTKLYESILKSKVVPKDKGNKGSGADYNEQYAKEFMAEADKLQARITQLQNQYKKLQEQGASADTINKTLNDIAYTHQLRQNALKKAADEMRAKQAEIAKTLLGKYGVNASGTEDQIDAQVKKVSAKNRKAVIDLIQDYKQMNQAVLSASTEWWSEEFEKTQTLKEKLENIQKQKKNINDVSKSSIDLQLKQSEYIASQYDEGSREYENQLYRQVALYRQKQSILHQEAEDLRAYLKTLKVGTEEYAKTKQEIDGISGAWYDLENSVGQVNDKLKQLRQIQTEKVDEAREQMQNLLKAQYDKQKQAEEERHKSVMKNLDDEMKKLEEKYEKEDYDRNLQKQNREISKKQSEIDALALDNSTEGLARKAKLEEELANLKEKKEDTRLNHQKEMEKRTLEDLKDSESDRYDKTKTNLDKLSSDIEIFNQVQVDLTDSSTSKIIDKYTNMAKEVGGQYDIIINKAKMLNSITTAQNLIKDPNSAYNTAPGTETATDGRKATSVLPLNRMIENKEKWAQIDAQQKAGTISQATALAQKQQLYNANNELRTVLPGEIAALIGDGKTMSLEQLKALRDKLLKEGKVFAGGGPVSFTGPAWLDGTPAKPEYVLKNEDFKSVLSILNFARQLIPGISTSNIPNNINSNSKEVVINPEINVYAVPGQDAQEIAEVVWSMFDKKLRTAGITV